MIGRMTKDKKENTMDSYTSFARVYDLFMDQIPYDRWCDQIHRILSPYLQDKEQKILLDLGCGTGQMTRRLYEKGYEMIGVDLSSDMLDIAREEEMVRLEAGGASMEDAILYLQQDMRDLELYGTVQGVVSVCDSMNYLTSEEDLLTTLRLVNNYLDPGGVFLFDMKSPYLYEHILGRNTFTDQRDTGSVIWENNYDPKTMVNYYDLTLFVREDLLFDLPPEETAEEELAFYRFSEEHAQKAYETETVTELIKKSGVKLLAVWDSDTEKPVTAESKRVVFLCQECQKDPKRPGFYLDGSIQPHVSTHEEKEERNTK
ncbi:MAG: class I SAM-dependent methyltransferase [Candidatus Weimeria sp.]|nr:class I SAM-dependent methyltransferase [Candidatus Weimeria sp.]